MQREIDAVHLRAVAQRGVEEIEPFLAHQRAPRFIAVAFAQRVLSIVVLASHSPPRSTVLRCCAVKPRFLKKSCAVSLDVGGQSLGAARGGELFQRIDQHCAGALPGHRRMDVEQVDRLVVGERRKSDRRAVHGRDQGELARQALRERLLVIGGRGPGLPRALAVIVRGQLLDAGAENLGQQRRVRAGTAAARTWDARAPSSRCLPSARPEYSGRGSPHRVASRFEPRSRRSRHI